MAKAFLNIFKKKSKSTAPKEKAAPKSKAKKNRSMQEIAQLNEKFKAGLIKKIEGSIKVTASDHAIEGVAMDSAHRDTIKGRFHGELPLQQLAWYSAHGFLGYSFCSILAQNWLIEKACFTPARDAARVGYDLNTDDLDDEKVKRIKKMDKKYKIIQNLIQFEGHTRVFGQRFAMMKIKGQNDGFYEKPFNIDGVGKGSFEGIVQIDPCWVSPQLGDRQMNDPASIDFHEPIFWIVGGKRIHRSHFVINRTGEVSDYLKPQYNYGGIPLTQKIFERVYAAEITANEAPKLAMTKRTDFFQTDIEAAKLDMDAFIENLEIINQFRDNNQLQVIDHEDKVIRHDTSLAHLDATIMTQYQLVASIAGMPATKLLKTQPKGFNSSGDYEESDYHEELESVHAHGFDPLLERYYQVLTKSEFGKEEEIEIAWKALDSPTEVERADINYKKAKTGEALLSVGAIDGKDERDRIIEDKESGYLNLEAYEDDEIDPDLDDETEIETDE